MVDLSRLHQEQKLYTRNHDEQKGIETGFGLELFSIERDGKKLADSLIDPQSVSAFSRYIQARRIWQLTTRKVHQTLVLI